MGRYPVYINYVSVIQMIPVGVVRLFRRHNVGAWVRVHRTPYSYYDQYQYLWINAKCKYIHVMMKLTDQYMTHNSYHFLN